MCNNFICSFFFYPHTLALPIVSTANASISVDENDNARGIFSFTSSSFTAEEGSTDSITVTRTGGTYGEVMFYYTL